jgi:hypothetical protein
VCTASPVIEVTGTATSTARTIAGQTPTKATDTPPVLSTATATMTALPAVTATPIPVPTATATSVPLPLIPSTDRERFGVGVSGNLSAAIGEFDLGRLSMGWYLDWRVQVRPLRPYGLAYWQMVRVSGQGYAPDAATIRAAAAANPGSTWLIGNEPDVRWQDGVTPERYAQVYGELYRLLKEVDPTCRVAIGGVSQPTPLRLAYLDRVLEAYRARYEGSMPVDVWNVHGFLLREERDSWGVDIPPGFGERTGVLYEIEEHDDLEAFRAQILAFRRWMAARGQRDRPLVVSEYGILMPSDYGFDEERVRAFMVGTFDYFLTARDEKVGYPGDGNRLVQWWAWYSLADTVFPASNLFEPATRAISPLGLAFARYRGQP